MQAEKKPLYTALASGALVVIVAFAIFGRWGGDKQVTNPGPDGAATSTASSTSGTVSVEVVTIARTTGNLAITAEYPRFTDAPQLSEQIERYVEDAIADFTKNATVNEQARIDTLPPGETPTKVTYTFTISWEHAQMNERFVSILLHLYAFEGGANGMQVPRSFNWDMRAQREVTLADLFPSDTAYLQRVSAYARQVLQGQLGADTSQEFLVDGTQPIAANFQWFTFTDEAVTLYFPKYQVAPGAAGEQRVTMPRNVEGLF